MKRVVSFTLGVVDILLAAFAVLYGAFVVFVMLRPWGGNLRALFFARHPDALLAFIAGISSRRVSGIIWCCAFIAFQIWLAA